ncbi:MAG: RecX family transcriptional regulator [Myxococcales bacterium]|nr:RecX family transcriptional regulator [Myxococcales bacterium]
MTARTKRTGPLTREELDAAALRYLDRFDSSAKNLRRVLLGYVKRVSAERGPDAAARGGEWVDELLARYQQSGLVDDARFAGAIASGLRRRGSSGRAIVQKLRARGVRDDVASEALAGVDSEGSHAAELAAAQAFVRRRRIGAFRPEAERAASFRKDLGALARAGFSMDIARRALGSTGDEVEGDDW